MNDWQPIETHPTTRGSFLVHCQERHNTYIVCWRPAVDRHDEVWLHFGGSGSLNETPTHWMPLPEPPCKTV